MFVILQNGSMKINTKKIVVDTNVLLWTFYGKTTYVQSYQKDIYPIFLSNAIENKNCKIYTTIYNLCELFNVVEKNEFELYLKNNSLELENFNRKKYRLILEEREKIRNICKLLYQQISNCIEIVEYNMSKEVLIEYNNTYSQHKFDMYDFILLKFCKENNIKSILTDDIDFSSCVDNINIITANQKMIKK